MTRAGRLLVVGPSWVGDMVMAQSLFRMLHSRDASVAIDVLAPGWSLPLLERMPEVASGIELPLGHGKLGLGRRLALGRQLRNRYDKAIVLPRSLKSALVPWFARIPVRTGFLGECRYGLINDLRPFDAGRLDQTVRRFIALGLDRDELTLPAPPQPAFRVDQASQDQALQQFDLDRRAPVIALMPGAEYGPAKQWPVSRFAELASAITQAGLSVWVFGSAKERELGESIRAACGGGSVRNLCGETSLAQAVDLLACARLAVSNDSGLMHVAAAVGVHVIAIYGSSTPAFTPPLTSQATIHYRDLDCSPCFKRECPLGHLDCLNGITANQVVTDVLAVLATDAVRTVSDSEDGSRDTA